MCDPTGGIATLAITALTTVAGGVMANQQARAEAKVATMQGNQALDAANAEANNVRYKGNLELGAIRSSQAASGVDISTGSAAAVGAESAKNVEYDALTALYAGRLKQWQGAAQASQLKAQGKGALVGSLLSAAAGTATGAFKMGMFDPKTTTTFAPQSQLSAPLRQVYN